MRLKDKVSVITGAGQGIGRAIAIAFAKEGSSVVVVDIDLGKANGVAEEVKKFGSQTLVIKADVSVSEDVRNMTVEAIKAFERIDILVNNAGIQTETPFLEVTRDVWERVIDVNLKGTFLCSQMIAREMVRQGEGNIINITSVHQFLPRKNIAHYAASKGGVAMLSKVMALELAPYKIRVNCIAPGAIATPMNQSILDSPELLTRLSSQIPWARIGEPEEVAEAALFLASEEAGYITGSTISIDGGLSLGRLATGS